MCFLDASFSVLVRHLGAQGSRNDTKMMPKVNKGGSASTLWNVSKAWQAQHGSHMGRSQGGPRNHFFQD
jgi:hypothetical protein